MEKPTHFAMMTASGRSRITPLVTNEPRPKAPCTCRTCRPRKPARQAHGPTCTCAGCTPPHIREKARRYVEAHMEGVRREVAVNRVDYVRGILSGPAGASVLDK